MPAAVGGGPDAAVAVEHVAALARDEVHSAQQCLRGRLDRAPGPAAILQRRGSERRAGRRGGRRARRAPAVERRLASRALPATAVKLAPPSLERRMPARLEEQDAIAIEGQQGRSAWAVVPVFRIDQLPPPLA